MGGSKKFKEAKELTVPSEYESSEEQRRNFLRDISMDLASKECNSTYFTNGSGDIIRPVHIVGVGKRGSLEAQFPVEVTCDRKKDG